MVQGTAWRQTAQYIVETLLLQACDPFSIPMRVPIGQSKVAVDTAQLQLVKLADGFAQSGGILPGTAQPCHAGVEFELYGELASAAVGKVLTQQGFSHAAQRGHEFPFQACPQVFGLVQMPQDKDRLR